MRDVAQMAKEISELNSTENFYENVRHIVGYYDGVFISDWDIKTLQRIADARYEELVLKSEVCV